MKVKKTIFLFAALCGLVIFSGCGNNQQLPSQAEKEITMPKPGSDVADTGDGSIEKMPEESELADEPVLERVSFVGCGDNIIYYGNVRDAASLSDGERKYNFKPMFEPVKDIIAGADIAFINQETVMAGDGYSLSYYPRFNSPREVGIDLVELGYDVINIANNHMLDKGAPGLENTIKFWKEQDCLMIGGYQNAEDYDNIRVLEKNGIKISFLSYTYATNGIRKPSSSSLVIPYINDEDIIRQTSKAKEESDFVIVSVHWGNEGVFRPNDEQKRTAQLLSDCGVDVIIGHHPHVIQPVEWLVGENGNKTLCVYSLGNFAAEQEYAYNMVGGIITFDIVSENDGKPYVENPVFNPTVFHFNSKFYKNTVYLMEDYTQELADAHGVRTYYRHSLTVPGLRKYVTDNISPEFLPESFRVQQ